MSAEGDVNPKAYPLADAKLTKDILELVHQAQNYVSSIYQHDPLTSPSFLSLASTAQRCERSDENAQPRQIRADQ